MTSKTMARPSWLMAALATLSVILPTNALYFYMDGQSPKCFFEELPKDTLVVGKNATIFASTILQVTKF